MSITRFSNAFLLCKEAKEQTEDVGGQKEETDMGTVQRGFGAR